MDVERRTSIFSITRILCYTESYITQRVSDINRLIDDINRLINAISRMINGLTRLINGWGARLAPGAAAGSHPWINQAIN